MDAPLLLPVYYRGEEIELPLRIAHRGYSITYVVNALGTEVIFEADDSDELRAVAMQQSENSSAQPAPDLLAAIASSINVLRR